MGRTWEPARAPLRPERQHPPEHRGAVCSVLGSAARLPAKPGRLLCDEAAGRSQKVPTKVLK